MLLWNRMKVILGVSVYIFASCCGPGSTETIATKAVEAKAEVAATIDNLKNINDTAVSSEVRFEDHGDVDGVVEQQLIQSEAAEGIEHQESIDEGADDIIKEIPNIKDNESTFEKLLSILGTWAWVVGGIALFIFLWWSGALFFIRRIVMSLGWFIPAEAIKQAKIDMKVADENDPMTPREAIGIRRSGSPAYEAARKKIEKWR